MSLPALVARTIVKCGKRVDHDSQWLTLSCGHTVKTLVGIAAWREGDSTYCKTCETEDDRIYNAVLARLKQDVRERFL